jgi:hypothetical protein
MSKLLERAIANVRELPEDEQDAIAIALFSMPMLTHRLSRSTTKHEQRFWKAWPRPNGVSSWRMTFLRRPINAAVYESPLYAAGLC